MDEASALGETLCIQGMDLLSKGWLSHFLQFYTKWESVPGEGLLPRAASDLIFLYGLIHVVSDSHQGSGEALSSSPVTKHVAFLGTKGGAESQKLCPGSYWLAASALGELMTAQESGGPRVWRLCLVIRSLTLTCVDLKNIHYLKVESYVLFGGKF